MADKKDQRFTFDSEKDGAEVPTLTSLLYKKNLVKSKPSPGQLRHDAGVKNGGVGQSGISSLDPTVTLDTNAPNHRAPPTEIVRPQMAASSKTASTEDAPRAKILPSKTPYRKTPTLSTSAVGNYPASSPAASGIQYLFANAKVGNVLVFLPGEGSTLISSSIVSDSQDRAPIWSGMEFSKELFADLWGRLEKYSFAEFSTLGIAGQGNVDRTAFRAAFQVKGTEWLTLVRVRQSTGGEALLAILSEASIQSHIPNFHTACMGGAAPTAKAA